MFATKTPATPLHSLSESSPRYPHLNNSTPSSSRMPTESVATVVVQSQPEDDPNNDDPEGDEGEGSVASVRKWTMDEDRLLINAWINSSVESELNLIGVDQRKSSFWAKVAAHYMDHAPRGSILRTRKTCNSRWNRAAVLVSKWTSIVDEIRQNQSGLNMEDLIAQAHDVYFQRTGKKFELEHWWRLLRDQPKWKALYVQPKYELEGMFSKRARMHEIMADASTPNWKYFCNQTEGESSSKRPKINENHQPEERVSAPTNEDPIDPEENTSTPAKEHPTPIVPEEGRFLGSIERKDVKRKAKQKASNVILNMVTNQLSILARTSIEKVELFREYVKVQERKANIAEEAVRLRDRHQKFKEKQWEERMLRVNTSGMCSEDAAFYKEAQEEIRKRYRQPSNELMSMDESSSSDGLSFIFEESSDDMPVLEEFLDDETDARQMLLLIQLKQAAEDMGALPSSKTKRKKKFIWRNRERAHERLYRDYLAEDSVYDEVCFRRRFRMRKCLFIRIMKALEKHSQYFQLRYDATGRPGLTPLTKCTAAMRMLAYGASADCVDEYLKLGESTAMECLKRFSAAIIDVFGGEYLRKPTQTDVDRLLAVGDARDFPGMLGSIDCMHWEWKNCPATWKHTFAKGVHKTPTLILELVASYDLWIWHALFGCPGTHDDINILHRSLTFHESYRDHAPKCEYALNGHKYTMGYFLSDGLCPKWATFVKTIPLVQDPKANLFIERQEYVRRDVKRAIDILQARFAIIRGPSRWMDKDEMGMIMKVCLILHNMIVEDERDLSDLTLTFDYDHVEGSNLELDIQHEHHPCYATYFHTSVAQVQDLETHDHKTQARLQADLVEEIWKRKLAQEIQE